MRVPWRDRAGEFSPLKAFVFVALFGPALWLAWLAASDALGPRPWDAAIREAGLWAIRLLWLSLLVRPARQILRAPRLLLVRRMIGVAALAYALLHLTLFLGDHKWDPWKVVSEIALRVYLTIGFVGLLGLLALGATSTDGAVRRLGGEAWRRLHLLAYAIGLLAAVHFTLQSKLNVTEPTLMVGLFGWLMGYRAVAPKGGAPSARVLFGLAIGAATLTAAAEFGWYALATGVDPWRVAAANLDLTFGPRPAMWVLLAGVAAAAMRLARRGGERARRGSLVPRPVG